MDTSEEKKTKIIEQVANNPELARQVLESIPYTKVVAPLVKADRAIDPIKHSYPQLGMKYGLRTHQVKYLMEG